jgi:hypothetical protein
MHLPTWQQRVARQAKQAQVDFKPDLLWQSKTACA